MDLLDLIKVPEAAMWEITEVPQSGDPEKAAPRSSIQRMWNCDYYPEEEET